MSQRLRNPAANHHLPHIFLRRGKWAFVPKNCNMHTYCKTFKAVRFKNDTGQWPVRNTGLAGPGQLG